MSQREKILRGRLKGKQRYNLRGLMDVDLKASELAEELGITIQQVYRVYVPFGCPHSRDEYNHIWINGKQFKEWYEELYKKRKPKKDQTYCVSCKQYVKLENPTKAQSGSLVYYLSTCPQCKKLTAKIVDHKKRGDSE